MMSLQSLVNTFGMNFEARQTIPTYSFENSLTDYFDNAWFIELTKILFFWIIGRKHSFLFFLFFVLKGYPKERELTTEVLLVLNQLYDYWLFFLSIDTSREIVWIISRIQYEWPRERENELLIRFSVWYILFSTCKMRQTRVWTIYPLVCCLYREYVRFLVDTDCRRKCLDA